MSHSCCCLAVLASSSSGNCAVVTVAGSMRSILLDIGLSPRRTRAAMVACGFDPGAIGAILLTHFDSDHFHGGWRAELARRPVPVLVRTGMEQRALQAGVPAYCLRTIARPTRLGSVATVRAWRTPHDELGSTAWRIDTNTGSLGWATDLGEVRAEVVAGLRGVDLLGMECNYDQQMQLDSGRPMHLVRRIMSASGHLENGDGLRAVAAIEPSQVVILHLSRDCNCPRLLQRLIAERLGAMSTRVRIAHPDQPSGAIPWGRSIAAPVNPAISRLEVAAAEPSDGVLGSGAWAID